MGFGYTDRVTEARDSRHSHGSTGPAPGAAGLFHLVAESLPGGIVVVDATGIITLANQEIERQFGYARGELIGQAVDILLPESLRPARAAHREGFMTMAEARPIGAGRHLFGRRRDGSQFPVEIGLNPIATDDGNFVITVVVDITARRQLEQKNSSDVQEQLEFERLVANLSMQFINLPADRVDDAMRDALRRIGEALDLDRCTFFRIQADGTAIAPVGWQRAGIPPAPAPLKISERFPWVRDTVLAGKLLCFSTVDEIASEVDRAGYVSFGIRSSVTVPLSVAGRVVGAVGFNVLREERTWAPEVVHRLRVFATAFGNVLARRESDEALQQASREVERLRDQLQAENVYLRAEARERLGTGPIVGQSMAVRRVLEQVQQVAATGSTVLLLGETGTGKELFATQIHELSARRTRAMVRVNCAAIPATLLESELFGREKGAFTGALARQVGRFELADHSSIFLDEIGDLPADVQVKLLRVLEERQIERLGSPKPIQVDTRIIVATHRNLERRIAEGAFREDLFYRLNVFPITVPPLRERREDIPLLVVRFVEEFSKAFAKSIEVIPRENMAALQQYSWPGNIRELRNVVERAMIVVTGPRLAIPVPVSTAAAASRSARLVDVEREHIRSVLDSVSWRIRGMGGAAERLGLRPTTLETRLIKLGLKRPKRA
jgi:formate hydrogenlyase transcriptional activator